MSLHIIRALFLFSSCYHPYLFFWFPAFFFFLMATFNYIILRVPNSIIDFLCLSLTMILRCSFFSSKFLSLCLIFLMLRDELYIFFQLHLLLKEWIYLCPTLKSGLSFILLHINLLNVWLFWSTFWRKPGIHSFYSNIWYLERIFLVPL